jgi:hypothetical protein
MARTASRWIAVVAAGVALAAGPALAAEAKKRPVAPRGFYAKYLMPQIASGLNGEITAATDFANHAANPWTRDAGTAQRVERDAIGATTSALKRYAIESLGIDKWSLPLTRGNGIGLDALKTDSGGTRLRFGFSRMAPRAEVLIPVNAGRVAVSADALGRMGATFETPGSKLRVGASYDARARGGTFALGYRF